MEEIPFGRYRCRNSWAGAAWAKCGAPTTRLLTALWHLSCYRPVGRGSNFSGAFRREAHAAARLNEPHIVPIHGYGEVENRLYVEMRLIEAQDLQTVLNNGPLLPARAVAIIEQIAMALDAVHQSGLVHRDVKPSNILIARYDFAY